MLTTPWVCRSLTLSGRTCINQDDLSRMESQTVPQPLSVPKEHKTQVRLSALVALDGWPSPSVASVAQDKIFRRGVRSRCVKKTTSHIFTVAEWCLIILLYLVKLTATRSQLIGGVPFIYFFYGSRRYISHFGNGSTSQRAMLSVTWRLLRIKFQEKEGPLKFTPDTLWLWLLGLVSQHKWHSQRLMPLWLHHDMTGMSTLKKGRIEKSSTLNPVHFILCKTVTVTFSS